jgi:hypothetical protein
MKKIVRSITPYKNNLLYDPHKIFGPKNHYLVSKNAEVCADFKLKKNTKKCAETQNSHSLLALPFYEHFYKLASTNQHKILRFLIPIVIFFGKNFRGS